MRADPRCDYARERVCVCVCVCMTLYMYAHTRTHRLSSDVRNVGIEMYVDGVPLGKSKKVAFTPIMYRAVQLGN